MAGTSEGAKKAWAKMRTPTYKAKASERLSKMAFKKWCDGNGWKVVFFESETGAARNGVVDAIMIRIKPREPDIIELKLVQLKSGSSGLTADEIRRLKAATKNISKEWVLAAFDGEELYFVPPEIAGRKSKSAVASRQ